MCCLSDQLFIDVMMFLSFQSVPAESALPAVTVVNVTTVTLVTVPVPVMQVLGAWPVICAVMDSMDPPVKVSSGQTVSCLMSTGFITVCFSSGFSL